MAEQNHSNTSDELEATLKFFDSCPPGMRFHPTDSELILHYLLPKINGLSLHKNMIMHRVNIYRHNPDYLTTTYIAQGDKQWYFLTPRDRKYRNGGRPNRKAGCGYWKATGADKVIMHDGKEIGSRKALVFYEGNPPKGQKTPWIMHEFKVAGPPQTNNNKRKREHYDHGEDTSMRLDDFVLCRIYKIEEGLGRIASRVHQNEKVENKGQNIVEANFEHEDEKVEDNGQDVAKSNFEQEEQVMAMGKCDQSSLDGGVIPHNAIVAPEISSHNNNYTQVNGSFMSSSSSLNVNTRINNKDWASTYGTILRSNNHHLANFTGSPGMQNSSASLGDYDHLDLYGRQYKTSFSDEGHLNDSHSSWMMIDMKSMLPSAHETMDMPILPGLLDQQDLDRKYLLSPMEGIADLASIIGGHNSFTFSFDGQFPT